MLTHSFPVCPDRSIQQGDGEVETLLRKLIVEHEVKKLNTCRRGRHSSAAVAQATAMDLDDEEERGQDD
jgi:hypothetical protein